jgi:anthranilate synthase component I
LPEHFGALPFETPRPVRPVSNTAQEHFEAMVERVKAYCVEGDVFQTVISQRFSTPFAQSPFALYRAIRRINPSPFLFQINFGSFAIVGSSPEILVRLRDGKVTVRPIAGTRPRGATPAADAALEESLLADAKERAEHLMLLDLGRNDVGRVASTRRTTNGGGVRVTESFKVERYSHVMHIVSNVEGEIRPGLDAIDAYLAGSPAGTVSGAPKVRAMQIIDELEVARRGVYAGGVGYFSASGEMDTCIALRTAVVKDGQLYVQAGAGVVLDSVPISEHMECVHKARAIFAAAEIAHQFPTDRARLSSSPP